MLKALLKKQLMELNSFYFFDRKNGKRRTKTGIVLFGILYALLFLMLAGSFAVVSFGLSVMLQTEQPWLYYCYTGLIALLLGTVGSAFSTYAALYKAKDNDLLLSMPIPPGYIVLARLAGVFFMGLLYESLVLIPAIVVHFIQTGVTVSTLLGSILLWVTIAVLITALSALLGYAVAQIASRIKKNKSAVTVAASLIFIVVYYGLVSKSGNLITNLVDNSEAAGESIRAWAHPLYAMGMAGEGSPLYMLLWTAGVLLVAVLTWLLLRHSFLHLNLSKDEGVKQAYREESIQASSVDKALFRKELKRLLNSPTYLLNAGLGSFLMPVAGIAAVVLAPRMRETLAILPPEITSLFPMLAAVACAMVSGTVLITAPSISIEGKTIWIPQSLPIPAKKLFSAKIRLHMLFSAPSALLMLAGFGWALRLRWTGLLFAAVFIICFTMFSAVAGLCLNLKMPNLTWTNETVAVKQGMAVGICIFGAWILAIGFGVLGFVLSDRISPTNYLLIGSAVLILLRRLLDEWLKRRGAKIFSELHV